VILNTLLVIRFDLSNYSKILVSLTWFISNTPLISKSVTGLCRFPYINDFKKLNISNTVISKRIS
jgi:hypothetical protein